MPMVIESEIKYEKFLKPFNKKASGLHARIRSRLFSGKYNITSEIEINAKILEIKGLMEYLNTEDLKDFSGMETKMYVLPAGCGPDDGIFFSKDMAGKMDRHSIAPGKYNVKIGIYEINGNKI